MRASCSLLLRRALAAAVPANYSNTPFRRPPHRRADDDDDDDDDLAPSDVCREKSPADGGKDKAQLTRGCDVVRIFAAQRAAALAPVTATPSPLRPTCIAPSRAVTSFNSNYKIRSFRHTVCGSADLAMRPMMYLPFTMAGPTRASTPSPASATAGRARPQLRDARSYGERLRDELSCRWAAKFYGNVTFGPRNYPYPSSRWLARRFKMKKHRIVKRFRFRRYKLAAVANLPFAKMIRVGMLPELKSSKTKKADAVDAGLSAQLVSAARTSTGGKLKGKRSRPRSKYQV